MQHRLNEILELPIFRVAAVHCICFDDTDLRWLTPFVYFFGDMLTISTSGQQTIQWKS